MHPLTYNFAYHVDSTTLADGDYELIPDQAVEVSEDPGKAVEDLTKAPNQSSENSDTPTPNPTQGGKPRAFTLVYLHCNLYYLYLFMHYVHRNCMGNPSYIFLGTNVLNTITGVRIAALLIGSVEAG
jgi:hypothetical protein